MITLVVFLLVFLLGIWVGMGWYAAQLRRERADHLAWIREQRAHFDRINELLGQLPFRTEAHAVMEQVDRDGMTIH